MQRKALFLFALGFVVGHILEAPLLSSNSWFGEVGGARVSASKSISLWTYSWYTNLHSGADRQINVIGYTYWTVGEYCPSLSTWAYWNQFPGDFDTNDNWYFTQANINYRGCEQGSSRLYSLGNHDFAYNNEHIYPYVSANADR